MFQFVVSFFGFCQIENYSSNWKRSSQSHEIHDSVANSYSSYHLRSHHQSHKTVAYSSTITTTSDGMFLSKSKYIFIVLRIHSHSVRCSLSMAKHSRNTRSHTDWRRGWNETIQFSLYFARCHNTQGAWSGSKWFAGLVLVRRKKDVDNHENI